MKIIHGQGLSYVSKCMPTPWWYVKGNAVVHVPGFKQVMGLGSHRVMQDIYQMPFM